LLASPVVLRPCFAQADGSLLRISRAGQLRIAIGASMAVAEAAGEGRLVDPLNEAVAELIAAQFGLRARILRDDRMGGAIEALTASQADLVLAPPVSRQTSRVLMFARPHAMLDIVVVARTAEPVRRLAQLRTRQVGLLRGYAEAMASRGEDPLAGADVVPFGHILALETALASGAIAAAVTARHQARLITRRNPGFAEYLTVATLPFGTALRYGDHDLRGAVDLALAEGLRSGAIRALFEQHLGLPWAPPGEI
jgi:polar amino acid transport system substrate-binding protein